MRLSPEVELAFFRIAQEALRNIERHVHAEYAIVTLEFAPWMVQISVEDDGCGFTTPASPADLVAGGRLGLTGMLERAELVGGTLQLDTAPGRGTALCIAVKI